MKKLILRNFQTPSDMVMLTAAVRDLHRSYPDTFITDVRTSHPALWENNPYVTPLEDSDPGVEILDCEYPLIQTSNQAPYHSIHGFIEDLNNKLGLAIKPTLFKGDVHLSELERAWFSQIETITGERAPFWLLVTGGSRDLTVKWWNLARFQEVVDHFRGRIDFVQVREGDHDSPPVEGVVDLRKDTDLRQLLRLTYHAQGVLTPVGLMMHLAAAVGPRPGGPATRPCVVVAGGREPTQWVAYPSHQFLHTIGALPCCQTGGCWKSRTVPLGDGRESDAPDQLCVDVVDSQPHCMELIRVEDVIRRIQLHLDGGVVKELDEKR